MSRKIIFPLMAFLLFVPFQSLRAQTSSISGTVIDSTGAVVPRAQVTAENTATNAARSTWTDQSGS